MKKSQRLRLAQLNAQATRTEAEAAELVTLQALAAAHADPAKDTDDAPPVEATTLGTLLSASLTALRGRNGPAVDLVAARAQIGTLTGERDTARSEAATLRTQLTERDSRLSALNSQLSTFCGFFGIKPAEIAGQDSVKLMEIVSGRVSALAGEKLGELGFPSSAIPPSAGAAGAGEPSAYATHLEAYGKLTDPVAAGAYYAKNIAPLLTAPGAN